MRASTQPTPSAARWSTATAPASASHPSCAKSTAPASTSCRRSNTPSTRTTSSTPANSPWSPNIRSHHHTCPPIARNGRRRGGATWPPPRVEHIHISSPRTTCDIRPPPVTATLRPATALPVHSARADPHPNPRLQQSNRRNGHPRMHLHGPRRGVWQRREDRILERLERSRPPVHARLQHRPPRPQRRRL